MKGPTTLGHAGDTQLAADDPDAARAAWHRAVAILDQLDHPDADQVRAKLRGLNDASADAVGRASLAGRGGRVDDRELHA